MIRNIKLEALNPTRLVKPTSPIFQRTHVDPIVVCQDTAHPNRQGHRVLGHTNDTPLQVFRVFDPGIRTDIDGPVTERAGQINRYADILAFTARKLDQITGKREFRHIIRCVTNGQREKCAGGFSVTIQIKTLHLNMTIKHRHRPIIVPTCECYFSQNLSPLASTMTLAYASGTMMADLKDKSSFSFQRSSYDQHP